jgi:hypothetical protein
MPDSKILTALSAFKDKYAWDKSLINPDVTLPTAPRSDSSLQFDPLEEFAQYEQARAQQDGRLFTDANS